MSNYIANHWRSWASAAISGGGAGLAAGVLGYPFDWTLAVFLVCVWAFRDIGRWVECRS